MSPDELEQLRPEPLLSLFLSLATAVGSTLLSLVLFINFPEPITWLVIFGAALIFLLQCLGPAEGFIFWIIPLVIAIVAHAALPAVVVAGAAFYGFIGTYIDRTRKDEAREKALQALIDAQRKVDEIQS